MSRLQRLVAEELGSAEPDPAWPKTRRMRWEMFHNGARMDQWPGTGLFVAMKNLRELGFSTTKTKESGSTVYRAAPGNGQRPAGRPTRGRPSGSKSSITWGSARAIERKPPTVPELGANVVVCALVENAGQVVIGVRADDGRTWFAILTEPPIP